MELNYSFEKLTSGQIENHLKEFRDELNVELDNNKVRILVQKWHSLAEFIICRDDAIGKIVGILIFYANTPPVIYTTHVWVSKAYRGLGICRKLLRLAEVSVKGKEFITHELEVLDTNCIAKSTYDKLGFKIKEKRTESSIMSRNIDHNISNYAGKPSVVISCFTYNHEPYIRDALEGFVMQKTNFPFVAIVHDDASTDGTAAIIREYAEKYPDIIKPIYETENQYSKKDGSLTRIMNKACEETGAKYIAMCEGDDYWTDPNKLQIQVDFLESHPDYSMCFHGVEVSKEYKKIELTEKLFDHLEKREYTADEILKKWTVPTCSVLLKMIVLEIMPRDPRFAVGDIITWLSCCKIGKVYCLKDIMGTYRINQSGWTINNYSKVANLYIYHYKAIGEHFTKINPSIIKYLIGSQFASLIIQNIKTGKIKSAYSVWKQSTRDVGITGLVSPFIHIFFYRVFNLVSKLNCK